MAKRYGPPDLSILFILSTLALFGLVMIYSSSATIAFEKYNDSLYFVKRQLLFLLAGIPVILFFIKTDYEKVRSFVLPGYFLSLVLLVLVLIIGLKVSGGQRWFKIWTFSLQPSEFSKIMVVLMLASFIDRKHSKMGNFVKGVLPGLLIMGVPACLIVLEKDLGLPFVIICAGGIMLFIGGSRLTHLLLTGLSALPVLFYFIISEPYRLQRIKAFFNPWDDPTNKGHQIIQSLLALGSGGFTGVGLGENKLGQLRYLPTPYTDSIFPIIGEELGFVGCAVVIALFVALCVRGISIARKSRDLYGTLVCAGLTFMIGFQAFINMAVATALLPTKGIPLPFISYGGSSLVFNMLAVGIILNISRQVYAK